MMNLTDEILTLFKLFNNAGHKLYIVGGAVRDYLLHRKIEDFDFSTSATPEEVIQLLDGYHLDTYQSNLGSIKVHTSNNVYEITTFRKEIGVKDYRYPGNVEFVDSLKEDVLRRDFTINALGYSPDEGIVDYLDGVNDLNNYMIRFIKDTKDSINEDPIRLIRALRFSLLLNFKISTDDLTIFNKLSFKVNDLGRIKYDELLKLFKINGCKEHLIKYFTIYQNAYSCIFNDKIKNILSSDIKIEHLKYVMAYYYPDVDFRFNKKDKNILKGLKEINSFGQDLYYTKLLMIEYNDVLNDILDIAEYLGIYVKNIIKNKQLIETNNHALSIKDLAISYQDLECMEIETKYYSKILRYLLNKVLIDNELNNKEELIKLVKEIKDDKLN